ncbi:MAG TPA: hypothetical protein DDX37_09155 [Candidatus Omnitrophica bacterium]|nr:hypothetical protein [Candidatus Omnitrophota bacterium]
MKTKLLVLLQLLAILFGSNVFALEMGNQKVNITVTQSYVSRYIWRGMDLYSDDDSAYQPSLDVSLPKAFKNTDISFNVWGSFPTSSGHEIATELDYSIKAAHDFEVFNLSTGYIYIDYPKANNFLDINEYWGSFSLFKIPVLPIDISLNLFAAYETEATKGGSENGWYYSWGFGTKMPLPKSYVTQEGQAISFGITNWGNDGVAGLKPSSLYATDFSLLTSYTIKRFTFTPAFHYVANYNDDINNGDSEVWGGIDISYSF